MAEAAAKPIFFTRTINMITFTAALIFSQNMFAVSSQIGVGDWEFWIDWKDFAWAPFVYTWIVAVHFPLYSIVFYRFFKIYMGATLTLMFWFTQRFIMVQLFFVGMNNYPYNYVQLPSYLLPAIASDLMLVVFKLRRHIGLYTLTACTMAGLMVVPGHFLFLNVPFLMSNATYTDPLSGVGLAAYPNHSYPVWYLIRMAIPKAPIPAYFSEAFSWPFAYRSFYDPVFIMTGNMAIMGALWSPFTYLFIWALFRGYEKTIRRFVEPAPPAAAA